MKEHSLFIRGLLDPSENELINTSNQFAYKFSELIEKTNKTDNIAMCDVTKDALLETLKLKNFKTSGVQVIIDCKIRYTILPLLSDNVL